MNHPDDEILQCVEEYLGPRSRVALSNDLEGLAALQRNRAVGSEQRDAILRWAFQTARTCGDVRDEFIKSLLPDLMALAANKAPRQAQQLRTGEDLVQSMLGDALPDLFKSEFNSRAQFISFLGRRIGWKGADRARKDRALIRGGGHKFTNDSTLDRNPSNEPSPLSRLEQEESVDALALRILDLPEQLRQILLGTLQGQTHRELAEEFDITEGMVSSLQRRARKALGSQP